MTPPKPLPETMSKDEMLKYYSSYANLCAHEALQYQKRIQELEKALAKERSDRGWEQEAFRDAQDREYYRQDTWK